MGTNIMSKINKIKVKGSPTFKKSLNLYFPGAKTKIQEGSKGAISETEAPSITAIAKVRGSAFIMLAVSIATGKTTNAAAALLIGCVSNITKITKPPKTY